MSDVSEKMPAEKLPSGSSIVPSSAAGTTQNNNSDASLAGLAAQSGVALSGDSSGDALKGMVASGATGKAAQSVESWLNQFGTARVKASVDNNFSLQDAELDVLLPLYDDKVNLLFTQLGGRRADDRNIINTGIGYRHFNNHWMWGTNTFYDRQISQNHHQRMGVGGELGWDYLKISANGYMRLTDWMASERYQDYDERAANGFDIRTEGYLPSWPQLGASAVFEQYYGDNVDLFNDEDNRQKDPYAVTVGLNYTPFTLMTAGVSQKMGKGDTQDTQFNLSFSYAPGVSLDKQLDASQVAVKRSLLGSRMDLVNRNNTIVLDYRKQDLISLGLPAKIEGAESATFPISAVVNSKYGLDRIEWQADELLQHGGSITQDKRSGQYSITLPNYQYGGVNNHYIVRGKAFDAKGNGSNNSEMNVYVSGYDAATWQSSTSVSPNTLLADGTSTSTVTLRITGADQLPVTAMASQLAATVTLAPASAASVTPLKNATISAFSESAPGVYTATFTSGNVAGTADITPLVSGKTALQTARIVLQNADSRPTLSTLSASKTLAMANGTDTVILTANVLTAEGLPYQGVTVSWAAENVALGLAAPQSVTDENGVATMTVSSLSVIDSRVTATVEGGSSLQSDSLSFGADASTAQVMSLNADKMQATANNADNVTLVANVVNAQNQPLKGAAVDWKVEQGNATLSAPQVSTDELGNAQITLASAAAGDVKVSARTGTTDAKMTDGISFTADSASMNITALKQDKTQAVANGTDAVTYTVTVTDANGNRVQNAPVSWSSDRSTAQLSASTVNTDAQGQAQVRVSTIQAGDVVISAQLPDGAASVAPAASFNADVSTAQFSAMSADKTQALANGADVITLSTTLTDAHGNPLADADVNWVADTTGGTLSASKTKTNAQGVSTIRLTSSEVTDYTVKASFNAASVTSSTLSFAADLASATIDSLVADKTASVVAGKDTVSLTATVLDANRHPVSGVTVNWSSDNGSGSFTQVSAVTDSNGVATTKFSSIKAQKTAIIATAGTSSKTQSVDLIADVSTAKVGDVIADKTQATANGTDAVTWSTTVKDANQNVISGMTVNWRSDNANITLAGSSSQSTSGGIATVTGTSVKVADAIMTASLTTPAGSASAGKVSYVADSSTAQVMTVTADKTQALADGTDAITLSATVTDAHGNLLANTTVNWGNTPAIGALSAASSTTSAQGIATVTLASAAAGNTVVTGTVNGTGVSSPSLTFAADASTASVYSLEASKTTGVVAGVDTVTVTATVHDKNGNVVPNATVNWSSDNASGKFSPATGVTDSQGVVTAQFSETHAQTTAITATAAGGNKTQSIEVVGNASTARLTRVDASKSQALANGTDGIIWTATVADANQNLLSGTTVKWSSSNTDIALSGSSSQTSAEGTATIAATSVKAANAVMTATLTSPAGSLSASSVSYVADASTAKLSVVESDKAQALANGADIITLSTTLTDAKGNPLANADVNWSTAPAGGTLSASSTKTNAQGVATVTLSSADVMAYTVKASAGNANASSASLSFIADAATAKVTTLVADKTASVVAGKDAVNLTATVLDASNHPVQGATVTWSSDNASGTFTPVSGVTNAAGVATATFTETHAQATVITASITGSSKTQSLDVIADSGTATFSSVVASKSQALASGTDVVTWTATVQDANQNPVNNLAVNWSSDNVSVTLAGSTTKTNASGVATVTATSLKAADVIITASVTTPALSKSASKVSYIADASTAQLSAVTTDKTQVVANGSEIATLTTTVTDAQGNLLPNVDVSWNVNPSTGELSAVSTKTSAQGVATVTLSSLAVGNATVTASVNGKTASSPDIAFVADAATAKISTLTADKTAAVVAGIDTVTLQATVLDATNHPVPNITVTWSSDNAAGVITPVSGVTDVNGVASATLTSTLAQNTVVTASAGSSQKTLPVDIVADANTAQVTVISDKTQAVANGTEAVTWTATVKDANNNPVNAASVDWSGDNTNVTLAKNNTQTEAAGTTTMTGTSLTAGTEIVTATLTQQQRAASASAVSYIADLSTAEIATLTLDRSVVSNNGEDVTTFTATVKDANGNPIVNQTVNWATTLNTLAGSTSVTDASGVATMTISGTEEGDATVTATYGQSAKSGITTFIGSISADWVITGSSGQYKTPPLSAYDTLGFIAVSPTTGPTSLVWDGPEKTNSPLTTPMTDEHGNEVVVNFGGERMTGCKIRTFNSSVNCVGADPDVNGILNYSSADNPGLLPGVYQGVIHYAGKNYYGSGTSFYYDVSVSLTVK
ncbi:Ig-like domain-containing protein [Rahnella bruchi]|uniref:Ig-like domain-containing protein n=4 Tax=Rahnella bruchi TaxID=1510573 RepID=UPI0039F080B3